MRPEDIRFIQAKIKESEEEIERLSQTDQAVGKEYYEGRRDAFSLVLELVEKSLNDTLEIIERGVTDEGN